MVDLFSYEVHLGQKYTCTRKAGRTDLSSKTVLRPGFLFSKLIHSAEELNDKVDGKK